MVAFKLEQFGGQLPAWSDRLIPTGQSASSLNGHLYSGELRGWRQPKLLRTLNNSAAKKVFRIPTITQGQANASLVFLSQPNDGDTVVVGDITYKFRTIVNSSSPAFDVLIGASSFLTAGNFLSAVLAEGTPNVTYGSGTCLNGAVSTVVGSCFVDTVQPGATTYPRCYLLAFDFGIAFNLTPVSENTGAVRLIWSQDPTTSLTPEITTFLGGVNLTFDPTITGASSWLEFLDPDTDVVRSQVANDSFQRYYFASPSLPPQYNTYDRIAAGQPAWFLGIPPPGCNPGVVTTGGGNAAQLGFVNSTGPAGSLLANYIYLIKVAPTGDMSLNDVSFVPNVTNASANFEGVVYTDNNGVPFELLNVSSPVLGCTAGSQVTCGFLNPTGFVTGVKYWIGIATDTLIGVQGGDGLSTAVQFSNTFSNGPPLFAPVAATNVLDLNLWGDLSTSSVIEARAYVYTWVSAYGEEGPPSPSTLVNGWTNGTWTISLFAPPPNDQGVLRNITGAKLYRTITSTGGTATFFFVAQLTLAQLATPYVDNVDDSIIALNNQLASAVWFPPPEGLQGIIAMPNGMMAGFRGNEIWFCEPYQHHAWPPNYVLTTQFPIVGLGVNGSTLVAATTGSPYIATGVNPSNMALSKIEMPEACISRGSVLSAPDAVYYASRNGLIQVTQAGAAVNTTEGWLTREKWAILVPQKNLRAIKLEAEYFCFGTTNGTDTSVAQTGFTVDLNPADAQSFTIWPQPGGHRLGFGQLNAPNGFNIDNVEVDPWTGVALLVQNQGVYYYDFTDPSPTIIPYTWRSKLFQQTSHRNFAALRIFFDVPPNTPAQNAVPNTAPTSDPSWNTLQAGQYGIIRIFADGTLVTTREIRTSGQIIRILAGFKADTWQFEFTARVNITNVKVATSVKELAHV